MRSVRSGVAALRVTFGAVWLLDAFFKWQPGFRDGFAPMLRDLVHAQPGVLKPWFQFWASLAAGTGQILPDLVAVTETALGIMLVLGILRRPTYIIGGLYALFVWAVGEGFGGPYSLGVSTDIGAAPIYALVFAGLLILDTRIVRATLRLDGAVLRGSHRLIRAAEAGDVQPVEYRLDSTLTSGSSSGG